MGLLVELTGQRFSRLVVLRKCTRTRSGSAKWLCKCDCGSEKEVYGQNLRAGVSKSCGCLSKEISSINGKNNRLHGYATRGNQNPLYSIWAGIKSRCHNSNDKDYENYGARGIALHDEWLDNAESFIKWVISNLGDRPKNHSVDRIDNDIGYVPGNLRWATQTIQQNNKRTNRRLTFEGVTKNLSEWASVYGMSAALLYWRLSVKKMSVQEALTVPVQR